MASVFFAVFFCVVYSSFMKGTWEKMFENMLTTQAGHIQIHGAGYWEEKVVDNFMFMTTSTLARLEHIDNIEHVSPRIETFAMASFETTSKGIAVICISPEKEKQKSNLPSRLVKGEYLTETDDGILIGEGLSKYLKANIGDTLALIGQGYHGASAAQLFAIRGIVQLMTVEMDNGTAYITLPSAQQFIDMPDGYSGVYISIKDNKRLNETMEAVSSLLADVASGETIQAVTSQLQYVAGGETANDAPDAGLKNDDMQKYEVLSWHFTMERILKTSESDSAFLYLIMFILYVIVGFGILGTVVMMTNERKREFCVMISLGMSRLRLATVVSVELFIKCLIGMILAIFVTLPITYFLSVHPIQMSGEMAKTFIQFGMEPILPMSVHPYLFINQVVAVFIISCLAMIYPLQQILKLKIVKTS
jgi:ABC-type lipoprotein release transport system permease subunit